MNQGVSANMNKTLKIIHITDYLMHKMGYQELLLPKWNVKHGHEVHIITSDRYQPIPNYKEVWGDLLGPRKCGTGTEYIDGITIHRLKCLWEWKMRPWIYGLEKKTNELMPDIIFSHGTTSLTSFRIANLARRKRIPVLMDNHLAYVVLNQSSFGKLYYRILKFLSRMLVNDSVYRFLGVASECCDIMEKKQSIPRHLIECLPLGIDTDLFRPDESVRNCMRSKHNIPVDAKVVLQTGKLDQSKRPDWLAIAVAEMMKKESDLWLVFVGSGSEDYIETIRLPIVKHNVSDRLRIIPFVPVSELANIYCMADICVYPAATSMSCLEAAACGLAVIMTDLPISKQRAEEGVGICYKTGDINDLREKIAEFLCDSEYRRAVGKRACKSVVKSFSYDFIAHRAEELMYEAIKKVTSF